MVNLLAYTRTWITIARSLTMECAQLNNGAHAGLHLYMYHNYFQFLISCSRFLTWSPPSYIKHSTCLLSLNIPLIRTHIYRISLVHLYFIRPTASWNINALEKFKIYGCSYYGIFNSKSCTILITICHSKQWLHECLVVLSDDFLHFLKIKKNFVEFTKSILWLCFMESED